MTVPSRSYFRRCMLFAVTVLLAAPLFFALTATSFAAQFEMKIGTATINEQQHEWLRRFKTSVERDSKGRIEVQIYPASQLGSIPREIENTQFGAIQGWVGPAEFLAGVDPRYQVLGAPALFTSPSQANSTLQDPVFNRAFLALGADKGLKGIGLMYYGENGLVTRRPIHSLDDLKGLKIRDYGGAMQEAMFRALGVTGLPMPLDQVLPAVQQGAIDGLTTVISTAASLQYFSAAKYFTELSPSTLASITVVSKTWFDALPADLQKIVVDDAQTVSRGLFPYAQSLVKQAETTWTAGGGEVIHPSAALQRQVREKLANVAHDVLKDKPDITQLYDLAAKIAQKYR